MKMTKKSFLFLTQISALSQNDPLSSLSQKAQLACARAMTGSNGIHFFFFAGSFACLATGHTGQTNNITKGTKSEGAGSTCPGDYRASQGVLAEPCLLSVSYPPLQHYCSLTKKKTLQKAAHSNVNG